MQDKKRKIRDLSEGPIFKTIIFLSIPIIFANLLQTAYQLVDTFWVGRLGTDAVAAISISFPIIFVLLSLGMGLTLAGTILVSQYAGKKDTDKIDFVSAQTLLMVIFVSVILSLIGYFAAEPLVNLMGASEAVKGPAVSFLKITFIGLVFLFGYMIFQSLLRGVGEVKKPIYIVAGAVLLNFILDPLLIFGYGPVPAMGVPGAALATLISQGSASIVGLIMLLNGKHEIHIKIKNFKPDFKIIYKIFKLGLPASIEQSSRGFGMALMTFLVASFGTIALAAYGIGMRMISGFIIITMLGFSVATSTMVGYNIGAGNIKRAEKASLIGATIAFVVLTITGVLFFIFAHEITSFFIPDELETIKESALFLRIVSLSFGLIGIQFVLNGTFRAAGDTKTSMILTMISAFVLQFPLAFILSRYTSLGQTGIWWSLPIANVITVLLTIFLFFKGTWKNKKLTEEIKLETKVEEELDAEDAV